MYLSLSFIRSLRFCSQRPVLRSGALGDLAQGFLCGFELVCTLFKLLGQQKVLDSLCLHAGAFVRFRGSSQSLGFCSPLSD